MKIRHVQIDNYRNLRHIDVSLGNIVTLVGENNSGKSNFLRALSIPLSSDDSGINKRLSWFDINKDSKNAYYDFLKANREKIINDTLSVDIFLQNVPVFRIKLYFQPENNEHYDVKDILIDEEKWIGCIQYQFSIKKPDELFARVKQILSTETEEENIQMSLLPMELFDYSITVPGKESNISYETLMKFRSLDLPAERDGFASNAGRLGSKALSDLLKKGMPADSQVNIEKAYISFFDTIKKEGRMDSVLNWQNYSDIPNAQHFFRQISILPNMPQMSSILGSIRLGYEDDNMFAQGLGHRNLVLLSVLLNSYLNKPHDISYRLITLEEPEAHLCISNVLLMISLIDVFAQKNKYTQIVYSTHNVEFVNKLGLNNVILLHKGEAINFREVLTDAERDYLAANPNTDILKLLYSRKTILVEGITEELLIKSLLQIRNDLNDIKVLTFHKGFTKIIDLWKKINASSENKLGIVRDYDNQPKAQSDHEKRQDDHVIVRTTTEYTLETEITSANYDLLKRNYGAEFGWNNLSPEQLQADWRKQKSNIMLRLCHDLINGELEGFALPRHIQEIIDFLQEENHEN